MSGRPNGASEDDGAVQVLARKKPISTLTDLLKVKVYAERLHFYSQYTLQTALLQFAHSASKRRKKNDNREAFNFP